MSNHKIVPQSTNFNRANFLYSIWFILFVVSTFYSIITNFILINPALDMYLTTITAIFLFIIFKVYVKQKSSGENTRRKVLIDNSFDTKLNMEESKGYYDNEKMKFGAEKLLANIHQSSLYTLRIVEKMFNRQLIFICIFILLVFIVPILGMTNVPFTLDILNFFLSYILIDRTYEQYKLKKVSRETMENACQYWDDKVESNETSEKKIAKILNVCFTYEVTIESVNVILNSKVKKEIENQISKEWEKMKLRYDIK